MRVRLIARIKNDHFYSARIEAGYRRISDLALATGITASRLGQYENFQGFPKKTEIILRLEEALGKRVEELFPNEYKSAVRRKILNRVEVVKSVRALPSYQEMLLLPSPNNPDREYEQIELKEAINGALSSLTKREMEVLKMRFGLGGDNEHTLEESAHLLKVSRERVRQIEAHALRKLKHPSRSRNLKSFTDRY